MWNKCQIFSLSITTLSFKMRFNFFHITTMEHRNIAIQKAFVVAIGLQIAFPSLALYHLHDGSLLMSWCYIIFTFLSNLLSRWEPKVRCPVADDAFTGFSDNDRRRCRSVAQTSELLHGNEWTSLRIFAVTLRLEFI